MIEPLPGYAPELNPVEGLWASLKGVELANLAGGTLEEVTAAAERGSRGFAALIGCPSRFCATVAYRCGEDEQVTVW